MNTENKNKLVEKYGDQMSNDAVSVIYDAGLEDREIVIATKLITLFIALLVASNLSEKANYAIERALQVLFKGYRDFKNESR